MGGESIEVDQPWIVRPSQSRCARRDVAAGLVETSDETELDWILADREKQSELLCLPALRQAPRRW